MLIFVYKIETASNVLDGDDHTKTKNQGFYYVKRWVTDQSVQNSSDEKAAKPTKLTPTNITVSPPTSLGPSSLYTFIPMDSPGA